MCGNVFTRNQFHEKFLKRVRWALRFGVSLPRAGPRPLPKQRSANLPRRWPEKALGLLALGPVVCFGFLVIHRDVFKQTSDHEGHPGWKVTLGKSRKNPT